MTLIRRIIQALLATAFSILLIFSIPLMNYFFKGQGLKKREPVRTEVSLKKMDELQKKPKPQPATRKPNRAKPTARSVKGGPRFAMDLGVIGPGSGAAVDASLVRASGGGGGGENGDVDERPEAQSSPSFQPPAAVRDAERDALVRLAFCVDASGNPYDIKVVEERPSGMGLSEAGRDAVRRTRFAPARKDGIAVSFCGLEQPFEIRFRD